MNKIKALAKNILQKAGYDVQKTNSFKNEGVVQELNFKVILNWYLSQINPDDFFFIQIGANDGCMRDPLFDIVKKYNLKGCLVEPLPHAFENLKKNYGERNGLIFEQAVISSKKEKVKFYSFSEDLDFKEQNFNFSGLSSLDKRKVEKAFSKFAPKYGIKGSVEDYIIENEYVPIGMSDLLEKHKIKRFDLLQIDAEGHDYEILKTLDLSQYTPCLIQFEHSNLSDSDKKSAWELLKMAGYYCTANYIDTLALLVNNEKN